MPDTGAVPVEPRPAASVIIVRGAAADAAEPIEVYMIRRQRSMKFLGGFYAFPGGKVDPGDAAPAVLTGCCGFDAEDATRCFPGHDASPSLAFWVTAVRELLEESGVLLACDGAGRVVATDEPTVAARVDAARRALVAGGADFGALLAEAGWCCDLRPLRYLSHFVTPRTSPIRFSARFFLCRLPAGQTPRLYTEETSEGFWIHPAHGYRRFLAKEMAMAEPAEYGLAYIAQFRSVDELWAACDDNREKFTGIVDRIEFQFWKDFDWRVGRWTR
ncbi:MAG TPA: NUDIX hydrolase [Methylomirabilota bacterium]|jgi:8-oxo-dGTP pyrophosphatase MutT (NUDIX family)